MTINLIEIDKNGHSDKNIDYEIKRLKAIEQGLGCEFVRIDPDKEDFDIFKAINGIFIISVMPHFVIPGALCDNSLSHFVIKLLCRTL